MRNKVGEILGGSCATVNSVLLKITAPEAMTGGVSWLFDLAIDAAVSAAIGAVVGFLFTETLNLIFSRKRNKKE